MKVRKAITAVVLAGACVLGGAGIAAAQPPYLPAPVQVDEGLECSYCDATFPDTDQGWVDRAKHTIQQHWWEIVDGTVRPVSDAYDDYGNWFSEDEAMRILGEVVFGDFQRFLDGDNGGQGSEDD